MCVYYLCHVDLTIKPFLPATALLTLGGHVPFPCQNLLPAVCYMPAFPEATAIVSGAGSSVTPLTHCELLLLPGEDHEKKAFIQDQGERMGAVGEAFW